MTTPNPDTKQTEFVRLIDDLVTRSRYVQYSQDSLSRFSDDAIQKEAEAKTDILEAHTAALIEKEREVLLSLIERKKKSVKDLKEYVKVYKARGEKILQQAYQSFVDSALIDIGYFNERLTQLAKDSGKEKEMKDWRYIRKKF